MAAAAMMIEPVLFYRKFCGCVDVIFFNIISRKILEKKTTQETDKINMYGGYVPPLICHYMNFI